MCCKCNQSSVKYIRPPLIELAAKSLTCRSVAALIKKMSAKKAKMAEEEENQNGGGKPARQRKSKLGTEKQFLAGETFFLHSAALREILA